MKTKFQLLRFLACCRSGLCLSVVGAALTGCVTTKTTVTDPDGTVTVTEYNGTAPGAIEAGVATAAIIASDK